MAWTVDTTSSTTPTVGTEATLVTSTNSATFVASVDLGNMVGGDVVELRIYKQVATAGTLFQVWKGTFGPIPPVNRVAESPPVASDQGVKLTLNQTAGTARAFPWRLIRV